MRRQLLKAFSHNLRNRIEHRIPIWENIKQTDEVNQEPHYTNSKSPLIPTVISPFLKKSHPTWLRYLLSTGLIISGVLLCTIPTGCGNILQELARNQAPNTFKLVFPMYAIRHEFNEAGKLFREQQWEQLARLCEQELKKFPKNGEWWQLLGYAHSQQKQLKEAEFAFSQNVRYIPDDANGWLYYATVLKQLGKIQEARSALQRTIQVDPSLILAWLLQGEIEMEQKRYAAAQSTYQQVVSLENRVPEYWLRLGLASKKNRNAIVYQQALDALNKMNAPEAGTLEKEPY